MRPVVVGAEVKNAPMGEAGALRWVGAGVGLTTPPEVPRRIYWP